MSYIKATAEVIVLDNKDIATDYSAGFTSKLLDDLKAKNPTVYANLMEGDNPILHNGADGLANLLTDMPEGAANRLIRRLQNGANSGDDATEFWAEAEAFIRGCFEGFTANRDKYAVDEENDSFDSEW